MTDSLLHRVLSVFIAAVWLINGLICKLLNGVPRHEEIVGRILGTENSRMLTILIGLAEVLMAIWILSRYKSKLNAIIQMLVIGAMNILEFILVPDLLLWGKFNAVFAIIFIALIYYNEFMLSKRSQLQTER